MKSLFSILAASVLLMSGARAALVSHYTFDDLGNLGNDSAGSNNGTNTGISGTTDGVRGNVASFTGGNSAYIHAPISLAGSGFTIAMWVNSTSWNNNRGIFQVQNGGPAPTTSGALKVVGAWVNTSGVSWGRITDTANRNLPTTSTAINLNEWNHIAYRADGTNFQVFVNGVAEASITYTAANFATHDTIIIGRQGDEAWDGLMDDFRVYDNSLSNAEILALATIPEPSSMALFGAFGLVALLRRRR